MDVSTNTSLSSITGNNSNTVAGGAQSLSATFDTFLQLLTAQMQNQDPLDPVDNTEYTNQLVQFTQAEQALGTNSRLDQLIAGQNRNVLNDAIGYIGQTVRADSSVVELKDGEAKINYGLFGKSASTVIEIRDKDGKLVRKIEGKTATGLHELTWNGQDSNGNLLTDGTFSFEVIARDASDKVLNTAQGVVGIVTGVEMSNGNAILLIGKVEVPVERISAVLPTPTA